MIINRNDLIIQRGIPQDQLLEAATIYYDALADKFQGFLDRESGTRVLARCLNPDCAYALLHEGRVVGIAGIQVKQRRMISRRDWPFIQEFGPVRGLWKSFWMRFNSRPRRKGELLMDIIALAPEAHDWGAGPLLLDAVLQHARDGGYEVVRLDVVDTTPHARDLYAQLGFFTIRTRRLPFLQELAGYSRVSTMIRQV